MVFHARRWHRRIGMILGLVLWGLAPMITEAAARDLTLSQSIDLAVAHDPETQDAKRREDIGKLKRSKAVQDFLPKIDFYLVSGPQTDYFGRPVTDKSVFYEGVGLEQPLYKGGTLTNTVKLAESETRRQHWDYHAKRLAVAADTIKAYYQVLTAQAVIEQYASLLAQGEEDLREAQTRLEAGQATRAEVLDLQVKLLEVQQKLSKARADYQVQISGLKKLTGLGEEERLSLVRQHPLEDIRANLDSLLSEAQAKRPDLKSGREEVAYHHLKTEIEKGKRWPQLSFVGRYEWENPSFMAGRKDWLVMLKASVSFGNTTLSYSPERTELYPNIYAFPTDVLNPFTPLRTFAFSVHSVKYSVFDRSSNKVEMAEAQAGRDLAQGRWDQLQRQIYYDVKDAHTRKEDSQARIATAEKQITLGRELLAITRTKFTSGYATLADVFKTRATLAEAQVNLLTAQNDKAVALGKLYQALGRNLAFQRAGL
jgi:outer membrane protein TolC